MNSFWWGPGYIHKGHDSSKLTSWLSAFTRVTCTPRTWSQAGALSVNLVGKEKFRQAGRAGEGELTLDVVISVLSSC